MLIIKKIIIKFSIKVITPRKEYKVNDSLAHLDISANNDELFLQRT